MLTGKQKRFLRKEAHHIKPIFQIGKGGMNENLIKQVIDALEARELIKISILQNSLEDKHDAAQQLSERTEADIVQVIGNTIILYKPSTEKTIIELPKA